LKGWRLFSAKHMVARWPRKTVISLEYRRARESAAHSCTRVLLIVSYRTLWSELRSARSRRPKTPTVFAEPVRTLRPSKRSFAPPISERWPQMRDESSGCRLLKTRSPSRNPPSVDPVHAGRSAAWSMQRESLRCFVTEMCQLASQWTLTFPKCSLARHLSRNREIYREFFISAQNPLIMPKFRNFASRPGN